MASVRMEPEVLAEVRDILLRSADAVANHVALDHDDIGVISRALRQCSDGDEFDDGLIGETRNPGLERWLGIGAPEPEVMTNEKALALAQRRFEPDPEKVLAEAKRILKSRA